MNTVDEKNAAISDKTHRLTLRLTEDDYNKLSYWAGKSGVSVSEFIPLLLDRWVNIENGDFRMPTIFEARLNQLISEMASFSSNVKNLEDITINGFDSLLQLTRGDNYLLDRKEDGEL